MTRIGAPEVQLPLFDAPWSPEDDWPEEGLSSQQADTIAEVILRKRERELEMVRDPTGLTYRDIDNIERDYPNAVFSYRNVAIISEAIRRRMEHSGHRFRTIPNREDVAIAVLDRLDDESGDRDEIIQSNWVPIARMYAEEIVGRELEDQEWDPIEDKISSELEGEDGYEEDEEDEENIQIIENNWSWPSTWTSSSGIKYNVYRGDKHFLGKTSSGKPFTFVFRLEDEYYGSLNPIVQTILDRISYGHYGKGSIFYVRVNAEEEPIGRSWDRGIVIENVQSDMMENFLGEEWWWGYQKGNLDGITIMVKGLISGVYGKDSAKLVTPKKVGQALQTIYAMFKNWPQQALEYIENVCRENDFRYAVHTDSQFQEDRWSIDKSTAERIYDKVPLSRGYKKAPASTEEFSSSEGYWVKDLKEGITARLLREAMSSYDSDQDFSAAGILLVRNNGKLGVDEYLLGKRSETIDEGGLWGTPGGGADKGEDSLETALREFEEELGSLPEDLELEWTSNYEDKFMLYVCRTNDSDWRPDLEDASHGFETDNVAWFTLDELLSGEPRPEREEGHPSPWPLHFGVEAIFDRETEIEQVEEGIKLEAVMSGEEITRPYDGIIQQGKNRIIYDIKTSDEVNSILEEDFLPPGEPVVWVQLWTGSGKSADMFAELIESLPMDDFLLFAMSREERIIRLFKSLSGKFFEKEKEGRKEGGAMALRFRNKRPVPFEEGTGLREAANIGLRIDSSLLWDIWEDLRDSFERFLAERRESDTIELLELLAEKRDVVFQDVSGEGISINVRVLSGGKFGMAYDESIKNFVRGTFDMDPADNSIGNIEVYVPIDNEKPIGDRYWLREVFEEIGPVFVHEFVHAIDPGTRRKRQKSKNEATAYLPVILDEVGSWLRGSEERREKLLSGDLHRALMDVSPEYEHFFISIGKFEKEALRRVLTKVYNFITGQYVRKAEEGMKLEAVIPEGDIEHVLHDDGYSGTIKSGESIISYDVSTRDATSEDFLGVRFNAKVPLIYIAYWKGRNSAALVAELIESLPWDDFILYAYPTNSLIAGMFRAYSGTMIEYKGREYGFLKFMNKRPVPFEEGEIEMPSELKTSSLLRKAVVALEDVQEVEEAVEGIEHGLFEDVEDEHTQDALATLEDVERAIEEAEERLML